MMISVQPPLEFLPPAFSPLVLRGAQRSLPLYLRSRTAITDIQADNVEALADLYHQFQAGKIRFMIAFRHPSADDPLCLMYLLWKLMPRVAQQKGISLQTPTHAHFIYDRGIPLWAGSYVEWLYPRLGGTPILRGKPDRVGLRSARDLFANGSFPIMAAPEGATNGHNEIISPLEPGISQLGFWCVEDLLKAGRSEQVLMVPIGLKYEYLQAPWHALEKLLTQLEIDCGLSGTVESSELSFWDSELEHSIQNPLAQRRVALSKIQNSLYRRLFRLSGRILTRMEEFYTRFYHQTLPAVSSSAQLHPPKTNEELTDRLQALLDVALKVAEEYFGLQPKGSVIDRCRRLEQAGWDYIYREDIKNLDTLSPFERGLANRVAEEASLRTWHMRLVESFVAVTGKYVLEKTTAERFAETTLLLWDMMTRIKGGTPFQRPQLGKQKVRITVGQPLSISDRWNVYQGSRRKAVADLTQDLQIALERLIV